MNIRSVLYKNNADINGFGVYFLQGSKSTVEGRDWIQVGGSIKHAISIFGGAC